MEFDSSRSSQVNSTFRSDRIERISLSFSRHFELTSSETKIFFLYSYYSVSSKHFSIKKKRLCDVISDCLWILKPQNKKIIELAELSDNGVSTNSIFVFSKDLSLVNCYIHTTVHCVYIHYNVPTALKNNLYLACFKKWGSMMFDLPKICLYQITWWRAEQPPYPHTWFSGWRPWRAGLPAPGAAAAGAGSPGAHLAAARCGHSGKFPAHYCPWPVLAHLIFWMLSLITAFYLFIF